MARLWLAHKMMFVGLRKIRKNRRKLWDHDRGFTNAPIEWEDDITCNQQGGGATEVECLLRIAHISVDDYGAIEDRAQRCADGVVLKVEEEGAVGLACRAWG